MDKTVRGTMLMAFADRGNANGQPFITMQPVTGIQDLSIWYPDQLADRVVPYPTTIFMGDRAFWGNDYCNVRHVTLVNSFVGIEIVLASGNNVLRNYMISNATGVDIRRNDWSSLCNSKIDSYKIGLHLAAFVASPGALPNGHNYGLEITNCHTGIYFENAENVGVMFARVKVENCENAIFIDFASQNQ